MFKRTLNTLGTTILAALPFVAHATQYQVVERPRQECWNEQVAIQSGGGDYGAAVIGGLAGGLLGNTVGGGNGRNAATAVGAVTGALVGDRGWGGQSSYRNVQRCRTVVDRVRVPVADYYQAPAVIVQQQYYATPQPLYRDDWRADQYRRQQWRREQWEREQQHRAEWRRGEWREDHRHHDDDD
ncbi:MAG: hypothetical protein NVSMB6_18780 [Burkholderiaceae bacterium]